MKERRMTMVGQSPISDVGVFRNKYLKKGFELVNITTLCKTRLGDSGWCNDWNEPDETIHHVQITYRREIIANLQECGITIIDDDKYCYWNNGEDFIIFLKVKK